MHAAEKARLRDWAATLPLATPNESATVREELQRWLTDRGPATVLVYLPMKGEVDLEPLVGTLTEFIWLTTRTPGSGWLTIHPVEAPREVHRYGFEQPKTGHLEVDPMVVDIALVPGLLFDRQGGRLGHGAGYYDQLLSRMTDGGVTVGVTLDRFVVAAVPMAPDDVPMSWLATESGMHRTG